MKNISIETFVYSVSEALYLEILAAEYEVHKAQDYNEVKKAEQHYIALLNKVGENKNPKVVIDRGFRFP